jgi:hypothetical protein
MKHAYVFVFLFYSLALVFLASIIVEAAVAEDPIIVGTWRITSSDPPSSADDIYYIYPDGTAKDYHMGAWDTGSWSGSGRDFEWRWNFGTGYLGPFIDTVHVESDGNHITYHNQYGYTMTGVRVADSVPTENSGLPTITYVVVGGGIAVVAAVGAALYYFFIASQGAESAASGASSAGAANGQTNEVAMGGGVTGVVGTSFTHVNADGITESMPQDPLKPAEHLLHQTQAIPMGPVNTGWGDSVQVYDTELKPKKPPEPIETTGESTVPATGSEHPESESNSG